MENYNVITNQELGHAYFYWESNNGRLFLASQVMKELGYTGRANTLYNYNLTEHDYIKFFKKHDRLLFDELVHLKCIGQRAGEVIFLTESGFWKLVMQSRKQVGIKTRSWLANEVLPSIRKTGGYSIDDNNPMNIFTERKKQIETSKSTNALIHRTDGEYAKFWNDLHILVTGFNAQQLKDFYKSKESAKEVLRQYAPHLEATEAIIADYWQKGLPLQRIAQTELHTYLAKSFKAMLDLGIDLKTIGK